MSRSGEILERAARERLLAIARDGIRARLAGDDPNRAADGHAALDAPMGAFVSLYGRGHRLRGCIGTFSSSGPLRETVSEMAVSAAFRDPRFPPLEARELAELSVEISALSPLRPIDDPGEVEVGLHGLQVSRGHSRGVLLPQVATRYGWSREQFLEETCRKAGLPRDAWRDPETRISVFTAEVFGERDPGDA